MLTGHSLGGAAVTVFALDMLTFTEAPEKFSLQLYTFGQPRAGDWLASIELGNGDFTTLHKHPLTHNNNNKKGVEGKRLISKGRVLDSWRVTHAKDVVPHLPGCCTRLGFLSYCEQVANCPFHQSNEAYYAANMTNVDLFGTCVFGK